MRSAANVQVATGRSAATTPQAGAYPGRDKLVPVQNLTARMRTGGNAGESA